MDNVLKLGIIIAVLLVVGGFMAYKIYLNYKNADPKEITLIDIMTFIMGNIEYFVDALQDAMGDLNGINAKDYETDEAYHQKLIETAITIIETRAAEVGIKFNLSHSTLVNLADIVIHEIIKLVERREEQQKAIEAAAQTAIPADVTPEGKTDITKDIEGFYE